MKALQAIGFMVLGAALTCGVLSLTGVAPLGWAALGLMLLGSSLTSSAIALEE